MNRSLQNCSYCSSETSSYTSENHDDEEIAMAIQAAEVAARNEARSRFKSSTDLIHRLFVCISGWFNLCFCFHVLLLMFEPTTLYHCSLCLGQKDAMKLEFDRLLFSLCCLLL